MSLSERAVLVTLSISQWTGRKFDKRATATVETEHKTDVKVGNFTKKLLPGSAALDAIKSHDQAIRKFLYANTVPWTNEGTRILASKHYQDFITEYRRKKSEFDKSVSDFLLEYPHLKTMARLKLGDLFAESDYPSAEHIATLFNCTLYVYPLPDVQDFRVALGDAEKDEFMKTVRDAEKAAMKEVWDKLFDMTQKAVTKLKSPNAIIRHDFIENLNELCALLPKLNVSDDAQLDAICSEVSALASGTNVESVRENPTERDAAAKAFEDAVNKMSAFMSN